MTLLPTDDAGAAAAMQLAASWAISHLRGDDEGSELLMHDEGTAQDIGDPQAMVTGFGFAVIALAHELDDVTDAKAVLREIAAEAALRTVELNEEAA